MSLANQFQDVGALTDHNKVINDNILSKQLSKLLFNLLKPNRYQNTEALWFWLKEWSCYIIKKFKKQKELIYDN